MDSSCRSVKPCEGARPWERTPRGTGAARGGIFDALHLAFSYSVDLGRTIEGRGMLQHCFCSFVGMHVLLSAGAPAAAAGTRPHTIPLPLATPEPEAEDVTQVSGVRRLAAQLVLLQVQVQSTKPFPANPVRHSGPVRQMVSCPNSDVACCSKAFASPPASQTRGPLNTTFLQ